LRPPLASLEDVELRLRNGTPVRVRPIRPADKPLLAAGHARLSPESVRFRYMAPKPRLTDAELRYLTEVDRRDHVALVAVPVEGPPEIVGVARFVRDRGDPSLAEFAIVVSDAYQRLGLGTQLARLLAGEARQRGVRRFRAVTLADNVAVRRLTATIARGLTSERDAGAERELEIELAA
jgi:RimJ/RimL family protein N-acetyltransferase